MSQTTYIRFFFLFFLTLIYFLININFFDFYVYRLFESCDFQYSPAKLLLQKKDVTYYVSINKKEKNIEKIISSIKKII